MGVSIIHDLIGGSNKAKHPGTMGSAMSVNMYQETNGGVTYQKSVAGIRHLKELNTILNGCHGTYVASVGLQKNGFEPDMFVVCNDTIYRVDYAMNRYEIGKVKGDSYPVFAESGGVRPFLLVADGESLQAYNLKEGGQFKQIGLPAPIDGSRNTIEPTFVQVVNGCIIVNDSKSGYTYYSGIEYPLSTDTRNLLKKDADGNVVYEPDGITPMYYQVDTFEHVFEDDYGTRCYKNGESNADAVNGLYSLGSNLIVFGPKSVEFWQRGASEYETWTRTSYTYNKEIGLDAPKSIASVNNTVFFVSNGNNAGRAIFAINGTSITKISDTWVDELLYDAETPSMCGYSYSFSNHSFYCLHIPMKHGTDRTICFDVNTNLWSERTSRNPKTGKDEAWNCVYPVWFQGMLVFGHLKDANLVYLDDDYHMEDLTATTKVPLIRRRQSPVVMNNYQNFILDEVGIEMNCGAIKDYNINPQIQLEISEDGGNTFTNTILENCGKSGEYFYRVRFLALGMQRLCVLRVTFSEDMDLTLTNASIRTTPLSYTM